MNRRFATHRMLLMSVLSLATLFSVSPVFAGGNAVDQSATPRNILQDPAYIAYQRYNGFPVERSAAEGQPQRDTASAAATSANDRSYLAYLRLNGFTVDERKLGKSANAKVAADDQRSVNEASVAAYQRLNGFL